MKAFITALILSVVSCSIETQTLHNRSKQSGNSNVVTTQLTLEDRSGLALTGNLSVTAAYGHINGCVDLPESHDLEVHGERGFTIRYELGYDCSAASIVIEQLTLDLNGDTLVLHYARPAVSMQGVTYALVGSKIYSYSDTVLEAPISDTTAAGFDADTVEREVSESSLNACSDATASVTETGAYFVKAKWQPKADTSTSFESSFDTELEGLSATFTGLREDDGTRYITWTVSKPADAAPDTYVAHLYANATDGSHCDITLTIDLSLDSSPSPSPSSAP